MTLGPLRYNSQILTLLCVRPRRCVNELECSPFRFANRITISGSLAFSIRSYYGGTILYRLCSSDNFFTALVSSESYNMYCLIVLQKYCCYDLRELKFFVMTVAPYNT